MADSSSFPRGLSLWWWCYDDEDCRFNAAAADDDSDGGRYKETTQGIRVT